MRVGTTLSVVAALLLAIVVGPQVDAGNNVPTGGADAAASATRGTAAQVTPTAPPPSVEPGDSLDIPANSGSGRRVVYSKGVMRVWLIEADGTLYNTHRVSGRSDRPNYGTYAVW